MTSFVLHILRALWHRRITDFLSIWAAMTITAMISVAWLVGHAPSSAPRAMKGTPSLPARARFGSPSGIASLAALVLFLSGYIVMSVKWEDFADYDDSFFTQTTLQGHSVPPTIWPELGRFMPLAQQEFNLIRQFTRSIVGYHVPLIAELVLLCCILLMLDNELSVPARVSLVILILILPGVVTNFTGLVFTERHVLFWLAALFLCVDRFDRSCAAFWAVSAVVCAQFMLYYKETAFLLLCGFAAGRLVLRCRLPDHTAWDLSRLRDRWSVLDICFIILGALFLLYYVAAMSPRVNMQYADQFQLPFATAFFYYLKVDLLAWVLAGVVVRRSCLILRGKVIPSPFWDGLSWGAVFCFAAYLYLRLTTPYYLAPVDFIAILYLGRVTVLSWRGLRPWNQVLACSVALAVVVQCLSLSAFRLFERKNVIHAKTEIADAILAQYQQGGGSGRLFFPFADSYQIVEFASYLTYRGVPVPNVAAHSNGLRDATLVVKGAVEKDEPCVSYMTFVCHISSAPQAGDLVIELPDDDVSLAEADLYRREGNLVFSYEPWPHIPQQLYPFASYLRVASVRFEYRHLPDRWLRASVSSWK